MAGRTSAGIASYHSSVLLNTGSTSKITPRNGNTRCLTTCPMVNFACFDSIVRSATSAYRAGAVDIGGPRPAFAKWAAAPRHRSSDHAQCMPALPLSFCTQIDDQARRVAAAAAALLHRR